MKRRRQLTPRVEALDVRLAPSTMFAPPPGNPPIVHPQPLPIGPAGPATTGQVYTAAAPYAPTNPW